MSPKTISRFLIWAVDYVGFTPKVLGGRCKGTASGFLEVLLVDREDIILQCDNLREAISAGHLKRQQEY
jgi:hypothetical protein